jgi:hypothetical protein
MPLKARESADPRAVGLLFRHYQRMRVISGVVDRWSRPRVGPWIVASVWIGLALLNWIHTRETSSMGGVVYS